MQECVKRGILFGGPVFVTYSHTDDDITKTLDAAEEAFSIMRRGINDSNLPTLLEGEPIQTVFRPK